MLCVAYNKPTTDSLSPLQPEILEFSERLLRGLRQIQPAMFLFCQLQGNGLMKEDSSLQDERVPLVPPPEPTRKRAHRDPGPYDRHQKPSTGSCNRQQKHRPSKLSFLPSQISSDAQLSPGALHVQQWLAAHPDPASLPHPDRKHLQSDTCSDVTVTSSSKRSVMIQVFERDNLLKNDLIPLDDNTEICISFARQLKKHPDTTNYRMFQITPDNSPYDEFKRQFGEGIRLFCRNGETVQLKKNTNLMTYYGTQATPAWTEMKHQISWEKVFDFAQLQTNGDKNIDTYNHITACVENAVRLTVGCTPKSGIYDTEFHIKLSFIVH